MKAVVCTKIGDPDLLEIKDIEIPQIIDGQSFVPQLLNQDIEAAPRPLFWHYPHYHAGGDGPYSAVRFGKWRLIEFHETGTLNCMTYPRTSGKPTIVLISISRLGTN